MKKQYKLTAEGFEKLEKELDHLKGEKRKEIAEKIKVALSYGDLSENSEYDDAKNEQAMLEAKIAQIEGTLKNAVLIDENHITTDHVYVGSKVEIENISLGKVFNYHIVGSNETNPGAGKISDESPVGKALIGRKKGDVVEVTVPAGVVGYKVLEISK